MRMIIGMLSFSFFPMSCAAIGVAAVSRPIAVVWMGRKRLAPMETPARSLALTWPDMVESMKFMPTVETWAIRIGIMVAISFLR